MFEIFVQTPASLDENTLILMSGNIYKKIKDIRIGDFVMSYNEKLKILEPKKVVSIYSHNVSEIYEIEFENEKGERNYIDATANHLFYTNRGLTNVSDLKIGDKLLSVSKNFYSITSIRKISKDKRVYDIRVTDNHNYFANGVLVHNPPPQGGSQWNCYDGNWVTLRSSSYIQIYEEAMWWNISTGWVNDTWQPFTSSMCPNPYIECWSNVTKVINSTVGSTIAWKVYANDTSNNWNASDTYSYTTTSAAYLEVSLIIPPPGATTNVDQNSTFVANATVTCRNGDCGTVYGTIRYNKSSAYPDTAINTTTGATPFYLTSPGGEKKMSPATEARNSTADETARVSNSDDDYAHEACSGTTSCDSPYIKINFTTTETYENVTVEGYWTKGSHALSGFSYSDFDCYNGSDWIKLGSLPESTEANITFNLTLCSNINGNYSFRTRCHAGTDVTGDSVSCNVYVDYIFLNRSISSMISCGSLSKDQSCQLNWTINATGDIGGEWKIGVLFNSSDSSIQQNHTGNATIRILECHESISFNWNLNFGTLNPNTPGSNNPAPGNNNKLYNVTNTGTCTLSMWIKGTDITNNTLPPPNTIGVGNLTWNTVNDYTTSSNMSKDYSLITSDFTPEMRNITTYYWLSVPPVYAGSYTGTITICGNTSQQSGSNGVCE